MVIDGLARGLTAAGHEVVLFATGDSTCPVPLRWIWPRALGTGASVQAEVRHVEAAYQLLMNEVDIIHDHTLSGPRRLLAMDYPTPVIATNHGPFTPEMVRWYEPIGRRLPLVAISGAQAASAGSVKIAAIIRHGIDMDAVPLGSGDGGYVAFLGRMNADKGPHRAIAAARAAGVPIRLAAKMWEPAERAFFRERVQPLLGADAVYVGEVGGQSKLDFLAEASVLVNPIRWPEPFGLVMIEAMACGTPVVSFALGAAPEIVTDGVNGFLCQDEAGMADAIGWALCLDRGGCRASVEHRFSLGRMVDDHVRLYRQALDDWDRYQARRDPRALRAG